MRFWDSVRGRIGKELAPDFSLVVHYYLASHVAARMLPNRATLVANERAPDWFPNLLFRFGVVLSSDLPMSEAKMASLLPIIDRHYNPDIMTKSMRVGGDDARLGFASCALPLILEHNTPNNSVALLWAEAEASGPHPEMRPLFRRRQRHS